jgi:hypothetical protein
VPGDHQLFVGLDDPNDDRAVLPGNDRGIGLIQALVQANAKESQERTDASPNGYGRRHL